MKSGALWVIGVGWLWQILGTIRTVAIVWEAGEIFFCQVNTARFHWFPVRQISRNLDTTISIGVAMQFSKQNFENFTARGRFSKKRKNFSQNFQVLQLQAAITTVRNDYRSLEIYYQMIRLQDV